MNFLSNLVLSWVHVYSTLPVLTKQIIAFAVVIVVMLMLFFVTFVLALILR